MRGPAPNDALSTDWPASVILPLASALPTALKVVLHDIPGLIGSSFAVQPSDDAIQLPKRPAHLLKSFFILNRRRNFALL